MLNLFEHSRERTNVVEVHDGLDGIRKDNKNKFIVHNGMHNVFQHHNFYYNIIKLLKYVENALFSPKLSMQKVLWYIQSFDNLQIVKC